MEQFVFIYSPIDFRNDLPVKCLIHPTRPLCFTLRQMQESEPSHALFAWEVLPIPSTIENDQLMIKERLFIALMSILREKSYPIAFSLKDCQKNALLKIELASIFESFTDAQKKFLYSIFFT